ncbi:MAG: hypothetical protein ACKPGH_03300 [Dolichospermum sp.]
MEYTNNHDYWQILITSSGLERSIAPHCTIKLPVPFTETYKIIDCDSLGSSHTYYMS